MINLNPNVSSTILNTNLNTAKTAKTGNVQAGFEKTMEAVKKSLSEVDELQHSSDKSVAELLTGKNEDITSVVSAVAKADMSFKVLVGVRNKLIEAYKQTMNMSI